MSITYFFLVLLLCLHLQSSCNARRLAATDENLNKKFHMLNQHINGEKMSVAPKVEFSSSNLKAAEASKEGSISETHDRQLDDNIDREKLMKSKKELKMAEKNARKSGAVEKESVVSVPWRLPRSKREENKQPGFNLDYSPPKTHPPSHN